MTINFQEFSFCWFFCFAYSLSKMALKLTSKIPIQVFFRNSSFFPAISDNLWLGGKHSWLWIRSARFKPWLDQKFFKWYFCCLMVFSLCDKYCCCQKCGLPIFWIFRSLKKQIKQYIWRKKELHQLGFVPGTSDLKSKTIPLYYLC